MKREAMIQFHKDSISQAAEKLFFNKGVEKTTVDDIARAAEYSKATIYVYFRSKEDIYDYMVSNAMKLLLQQIKIGIDSGSNALEQYQEICAKLVDFSNEHPTYLQSLLKPIAFDEESRKKSPALEDIFATGELINEQIGIMINNGIKQGLFREDVQALPTGILFWSTLSSAIELANNKEDYILSRMGLAKQEFLEFAFRTLAQSVLKEGVKYE
jgi:AcrR family transcriptional regulator